jgi:hypothetical protein
MRNTVDVDIPLDQQKGQSTTPAGTGVISEIVDGKEAMHEYGSPFNRIKFNDPKLNDYTDGSQIGIHGIYLKEYDIRKAILDNPAIKEKLISYGCINVPANFLAKNTPTIGDSIYITKEPR